MQVGYILDSKVLDIDSLDLAMGKMMEQGPVLVITFNSQQILWVKDRKGKVIRVPTLPNGIPLLMTDYFKLSLMTV